MTSAELQARLDRQQQQIDDIMARMEELERKAAKKRFTPPSVNELRDFFRAADARFTVTTAFQWAQKVHDFYESKGWVVGKAKMISWHAAARNSIKWESCPVNTEPKLSIDELPQDRTRPNGITDLVGPNYPPRGLTDAEREASIAAMRSTFSTVRPTLQAKSPE